MDSIDFDKYYNDNILNQYFDGEEVDAYHASKHVWDDLQNQINLLKQLLKHEGIELLELGEIDLGSNRQNS